MVFVKVSLIFSRFLKDFIKTTSLNTSKTTKDIEKTNAFPFIPMAAPSFPMRPFKNSNFFVR